MTAGGRVAAASLAFSGGGHGPASSSLSSSSPSPSPSPFSQIQHAGNVLANANLKPPGDGPPSLPRRASSNTPVSVIADQTGLPGAEVDKLVTRKASVCPLIRVIPRHVPVLMLPDVLRT